MPRKRTDEGASALEARIGRLYAEPMSSFVTARNALASELRREDPAASARVKGLARPSISAWAINQVYWHARDDYDRLLAAGDELRRLQQQVLAGRGVDAREAAEVRQDAIRRVTDRAAAFLAEAGHPPSDTVRQRLAVTADAIAAFGSHPASFTHGRLEKELEPPGFEALASLGAPSLRLVKSGRPAPSAPPPPSRPAAGRHGVESSADRDRRAREAEQQRARAEQDARRALEQAERDLQRQTNRAVQAARDFRERELRLRELVTRRERLEQELARAQAAEAAAERELQQARAQNEAAESARSAAAAAEARARAALEAHTRGDA